MEELGLKKIKVKPDQINLSEPIKKIGEYDIEIELHPEAKISIKVIVTPLLKLTSASSTKATTN